MTTSPDPLAPLSALKEVWSQNVDLVNRFQLKYRADGMNVIGRSWYVPLTVGIPEPDAYELARAIDALQEQVERRSGMDVSLVLDLAA